MDSPKIIIIGNSYSAGTLFYSLQKALSNSRYHFEISLFSNKNYFIISDLLIQYLGDNIDSINLGQLFRKVGYLIPGIYFQETEIKEINFKNKFVETIYGKYKYDCLVLAPENDKYNHNFSNESNKLFYSSNISDIQKIKNHILKTLDRASNTQSEIERKELLTFSVIGANERGFEIACTLSDLVDNLIKRQYPRLNPNQKTINLIEKEKTIDFLNKNSYFKNSIFSASSKRGIKIFLNTIVEKISENKIFSNSDNIITSETIIFSGFPKICSLIENSLLKTNEKKKVIVDLYNSVLEEENVFIIGETSECIDLSPNTYKNFLFYKIQAENCANNILSLVNGNNLRAASLSNQWYISFSSTFEAVLDFGKYHLTGIFAWLLSRVVFNLGFFGFEKKISSNLGLLNSIFGLKDFEILNTNEKQPNSSVVSI